jgi:hypothetical protein
VRAGLDGRSPLCVRGQCDQRTYFDRQAQNGLDAHLSDTDLLQDPLSVSTSPAKASSRSREAEFDVNLFVIGGGSGGIRAARVASGHSAKVMLAERRAWDAEAQAHYGPSTLRDGRKDRAKWTPAWEKSSRYVNSAAFFT